MKQQIEAVGVDGLGPDPSVEARDGLGVVVEDVRPRLYDSPEASRSPIKLAETAREDSAAETWERVSQRVVEAWRESVLRALQAQAEWTRIWSERLAESAGMPTEVAESARRFHAVVQTWTDAQARPWEGWFETVQKASPEHLSSAWDQLMSGWLQGAQRILDAQSQWGQLWTSAATPAEKHPAAATRSKTAKATRPASET